MPVVSGQMAVVAVMISVVTVTWFAGQWVTVGGQEVMVLVVWVV